MEQQLVHYRIGGKLTHCGVEMLPNGHDIPNIIIEKVVFHETLKVNGQLNENAWEAYFVPNNGYTKLPMMLNSTNRKRLAKQAGTDYLQTVKYFPVRLTKEQTRDPKDGGSVDGLRISKIPAEKKTLTKDSEDFAKVKAHIASSNDPDVMLKCKAYYNIDQATEKLLLTK